MNFWDDASLSSGGDYVKWEAIGDKVEGTIASIDKQTFDDGKAAARFTFQEGGPMLTASQTRLKRALHAMRPEVGDHLSVTFVSTEKVGKGTAKNFAVVHKRQGEIIAETNTANNNGRL